MQVKVYEVYISSVKVRKPLLNHISDEEDSSSDDEKNSLNEDDFEDI